MVYCFETFLYGFYDFETTYLFYGTTWTKVYRDCIPKNVRIFQAEITYFVKNTEGSIEYPLFLFKKTCNSIKHDSHTQFELFYLRIKQMRASFTCFCIWNMNQASHNSEVALEVLKLTEKCVYKRFVIKWSLNLFRPLSLMYFSVFLDPRLCVLGLNVVPKSSKKSVSVYYYDKKKFCYAMCIKIYNTLSMVM